MFSWQWVEGGGAVQRGGSEAPPTSPSSSHQEKRLSCVRFPPHKRPKGQGSGYIIIWGEEAAEEEVWTGNRRAWWDRWEVPRRGRGLRGSGENVVLLLISASGCSHICVSGVFVSALNVLYIWFIMMHFELFHHVWNYNLNSSLYSRFSSAGHPLCGTECRCCWGTGEFERRNGTNDGINW